jgi:hypothetical protein
LILNQAIRDLSRGAKCSKSTFKIISIFY